MTREKLQAARTGLELWEFGCRYSAAETSCCFFLSRAKKPAPEQFAAEIPKSEKERGGLDTSMRLWIILDEYNTDVLGNSFYLKPNSKIGRISLAFLKPLLLTFLKSRSNLRHIPKT
jgi:hypothetical protein